MESSGSQTSQPLGDGSDNPLVDLVDAQVAFDQDDARRLPCAISLYFCTRGCKRRLAPARSGFRPLRSLSQALVAAPRARKRGLQRGQQQQCEVGLQAVADEAMEFENDLRAQLTAAALVGFRRIRIASQRIISPAVSAGVRTSAITWARSPNISAISAMGARPFERESRSRARMRSPVAVPPGWRVMRAPWPRFFSHAARRLICVVLPEPSRPSNVINRPRGMG